MSKQYNIRWGRRDYSRLSHLVRKVNKKVFEIEVKRPDIADFQPAMLDYAEAKAQIKTRKDFEHFMNKYNRYLREGAEEVEKSERGATATKFEINEFSIAQRAENIRRANMRKKMGEQEVTIAGKGTGNKRAEMGSIVDNATKPSRKKFKNMSQGDWENAFRQFDRKMYSSYTDEQRKKQIRNYVKGLIAEGYPDELIELMKRVDLETFERVFYNDEIATIDFIYDPIELRAKSEMLTEFWEKHAGDSVVNNFDVGAITSEVISEYENGERIKGVGHIGKYKRRR